MGLETPTPFVAQTIKLRFRKAVSEEGPQNSIKQVTTVRSKKSDLGNFLPIISGSLDATTITFKEKKIGPRKPRNISGLKVVPRKKNFGDIY